MQCASYGNYTFNSLSCIRYHEAQLFVSVLQIFEQPRAASVFFDGLESIGEEFFLVIDIGNSAHKRAYDDLGVVQEVDLKCWKSKRILLS